MSLAEELERHAPDQDTVLTIGVFDGVHLGHQYLFRQVKAHGQRLDCLSGALTFINHPMTVLRPETPVFYLMRVEERLELMRDQELDLVVPLHFTSDVRNHTAREFVSLLKDKLRLRALVIGPDFALGRGREGSEPVLRGLGREMRFEVHTVKPVVQDGMVVSSTAIRQAVARGDMEAVAKGLGRPFSMSGAVVRGAGRGRELGFPTANIAYRPDQALPSDGIYVCKAYVGGQGYKAATSVGLRPTFEGQERTVEAYLLDFQSDLYGKSLKLEFLHRLRDEIKFSRIEDLVAQMKDDVAKTRAMLA